MKLALTIFITFCLLCPQAWGARKLTKEESKAILADFERLSNLSPKEVEAMAPDVLEQLRNGESLTDFFIAFNIYAENLFNRGSIDKALQKIDEMLPMALATDNEECKVIALRTQGQFFYKLGLYDRASECFRQAMEICPHFDSDRLEHCFTWSSTLFWLVQADIHNGRLQEAEHWIGQMEPMMQWLDDAGRTDRIGYKPVMIRGLRAKIALQRGRLDDARALLGECPPFFHPEMPKRAYVEYYVANMLLMVKENRHAEAIPLLDSLIAMHIDDYKPIAAEFVLRKGQSLAAVGRYRESAETLVEYIALKEQVDEVAMAQQLDESATRYRVEKLLHEHDNMRRQLFIVMAVCIALAVIISLIVANQKKVRQKNQSLARSISELNRLAREKQPVGNIAADSAADTSNAELVDTGNRIVDFINSSQCYRRADCSRDTIKEGLGVPERVLAKAMVAATGLSFVNYINRLRLNLSIEMLEEKPEMTINDISTACGFGTVRQFQRIFKQCYDLTPSAYREARANSKTDLNN